MYPSRGNNSYGQQQQQQQPYSGQSAFGQHLGPDVGASQMSISSRHSAMLGAHSSAGSHYGSQYTSVYGSMALSSALQAPAASAKGSGSSALEGRSGYASTMQELPKFASGDYSPVSQKYDRKGEQVFTDKLSDYPPGDRRPYVERSSAYTSRDSQTEPPARFGDSIAFGRHQHQPDIYDSLDAASALRKELLQAQTLQSTSIEGSSRQADYLAARAAAVRHAGQEFLPYSGRMDADPNTLSVISGLSHRGQHAPSILGAAPRRDVDDLVYAHSSANPGYGVSLPPGRDYASRKGLHGSPLEPEYPGVILARAGYARLDDPKDDRGRTRELERRDEERRRELLREREREQERERERERERKRERERILERREKERERERKRVTEIRRERTPPRISRDRGGSTSKKAEISLRWVSPHIEASHRRRSPVKEKRREYVCKVYSSSLVDVERDYLSIDKRYPRLFSSPECSKVIVNWSRVNLKIPLNVPVSFEHYFVQDDTETQREVTPATIVHDPIKSDDGGTRWNAKIILMSGLSRNALEELSSERDYEDRIPHLCNMLRFACLKNGNSFMAIGGLWETVDGEDPAIDKSSLVQAALRHAKDLTGLDLKNCQHWNPFLEIHYDRVGKDGLFSHKEVTVLYIPDLSDCLPSLDAWRDQWLAHKKAVAERERPHALKREISQDKKEGLKDKEPGTTKDLKKDAKAEKRKATGSSGQASKINEKAKGKAKVSGKEVVQSNVVIEKKDGVETIGEGTNSAKKSQVEVPSVQTTGSGKKKIIRKVIKKKVVAEKDKAGNAAKQNDTLDPKNVGEAAGRDEVSSGNPSALKTFTRKKVTKKVPVVKDVEKEGTQSEVTEGKEQESSENMPKNADAGSTSGKTTVKKKIIKRVTKRKVVAKDANNKDKVAEEAGITTGEQSAALGNRESEVKLESNESVSEKKVATVVPEQKKDGGGSDENESRDENNNVKEEKKGKDDGGSSSKMKIDNDYKKVIGSDGQIDNNEKSKDGEKSKERKVRKDKDGTAESKGKEVKDKKAEDPPRHPGFFLQMKGDKDSKLCSLSLSLDSLLDYDDNDIEESTFELSLFAETFYEMLQYQMGSRLLAFLEKLRIRFVAKRNIKKRQREEVSENEKVKTLSAKRVKTDDSKAESKSVKSEMLEEARPEDEKTIAKVENMFTENVESTKPEGEDPDGDAEEDREEDEDMANASPEYDTRNEERSEAEKGGIDLKSKNMARNVKSEQEEDAKETMNQNVKLEDAKKQEKAKVDMKKKETPVSIDRELLQAFRFFDRNRVGYIRVEDMRLIIHNLRNFLSHRDVKELVQSALLESNTGRDDRILYNKLVRMSV